jgi:hypothetical protein
MILISRYFYQTYFLIILTSTNIFAQETATSFLKNICDYKTANTQYSEGVKMKLSIPCLWKKVISNSSEEQTKFGYSYDDVTLSEILNIKTLPDRPTKADLDNFYSQKTLTQLGQGLGTLISVKKVQIDKESSGEIVFKTKTIINSTSIYTYSIQYFFLYKNKMIIIGYSAGSPSDQNSKKAFSTYKILFQDLSKLTKFLDK